MKRRYLLFVLAIATFVAIVALAPKKEGKLLLLEWANKAKAETPAVAVLVEMGLKDMEITDWSGRAVVTGAKVVKREGYRFREDDKLVEPDGWQAKTRRPIRTPRGNPPAARLQGLMTVGVVLHLTDVLPDGKLTLETKEKKLEAVVALKDVLAGRPALLGNGELTVRRISAANPIVAGKTEDDFPAACYDRNGYLWVAYISYTVKDESRRIDQPQLKEQPANFKAFFTPEFGDQLCVMYYHSGRWSKPTAVTGDKEDLVRCAITADGAGGIWVAYSANRQGNFDIYARRLDLNTPEAVGHPAPNLGQEQRVTTASAPDLTPVMCTDQNGKVWLACQSWNDKGSSRVSVFNYGEDKWSSFITLPFPGKDGENAWHPALAAGPDGKVAVAYDVYRQGDYDVELAVIADKKTTFHPIAESPKFEARPALAYDPRGRLWIAYEEGPDKWGKDFGALDDSEGNPLYSTRSVRVACLADGKLVKPSDELPTGENTLPKIPYAAQTGPRFERGTRYSTPSLGVDGKGRVWLTYQQKFGTRTWTLAGSYWLTFARRLDGDKWTQPMEIHHSDGLLDHRPVLLPHVSGGAVLVHNTDGRYTVPQTIDNQIYLSALDLPGELAEPKLIAHEPGKKDGKAAAEEAAAVKRIRDYRIEHGGKKLQLLRGEFHRHTAISWDGGPDGSLEDMFRYGIDAAAFDWIGNGDHDNGAGREYSWWLTQKLTDAYFVKDVFTPMFTYERSVGYPHGHRNCMFAQRGVRTLNRLAPEQGKAVAGVHADDAKMLYRYLHEMKGICAMHTSATGMGTDWRDNDPVVEPIVEIYQGDRMSYEYEGAPRSGFDPRGNKLPAQIGGWQPLGFLNHAFKKGYKLGFQASSDHWSTHISYCIVLAERRDREAIMDALRKRHCYGATDNIIVDVRSGAHIMGDAFKTNAAPMLEMTVTGTKPIKQIDILKDSEVVETIKPGKQEYTGKWTDPKPTAGEHYYYIRVLQVDDEIAWASPMWIEVMK